VRPPHDTQAGDPGTGEGLFPISLLQASGIGAIGGSQLRPGTWEEPLGELDAVYHESTEATAATATATPAIDNKTKKAHTQH
jgi:hypothetical protein